MTETPLYTHPDIRNQTSTAYMEKLTRLRQRRLVAALEHRNLAMKKIEAEKSKLGSKWVKLEARLAKKLVSIEDDLIKLERDLETLAQYNHQIAFMETGLDSDD